MSKPRTKQREKELQKFIKETEGMSMTKRALKWFQQNVNEVVVSQEFALLPGKKNKTISHNMRRIFELRDEMGYNIINHTMSKSLKVDEWMLLDINPNPKLIRPRGVTKPIMVEVFNRDNFTCQFCGKTKDSDDPFRSGRKITLHVGHIIAHKQKDGKNIVKVGVLEDIDKGKKFKAKDFLTQCNVCNEGSKNNDLVILSDVEKILKLSENIQKNIYNALKKKFS